MKQLLLIFTVLAFISCQNQGKKYQIIGNVKEVPDSAIIDLYIQYEDMGQRISSDTIINGQFEFSDTLKTRPSKMMLLMRDMDNYYGSCQLWVDYEIIKVTGQGKFLSSWKIDSKVEEQIALNNLVSKTKELTVMRDSLFMIMMNNMNMSEQISNKIDSISEIQFKIEFSAIEDSPNSQSALEMLYQIAKFDTTIDKNIIKRVFDKMSPTFQNSLYGEGIMSIIKNKPIPEVGDEMVNFVAYDTKGREYNLSDFKGKYVLLDFWALACGPCIKAIPETRELYSRNNDILTVIGLNMITNEDSWRETSKRDSITWINLSDGKGTFAGVSADYGIQGTPTYILINPEGVIVEKWMGYWPNVFVDKLSKHIEGLKK
ncbi:MAG: TlpA disulfide reductase family protein [Bacteroidales bacterium]|jgi:thiol-disulfide isomerase/thioredoxin|nr:TlpA disulfide reductase family protein [Bacteroidales bacterium]MDY0198589.1 TlpA disulfide reductase family protein [Tenuifilaceae bacterium]